MHRIARPIVAAVASGLLAGATAGFGARVVMYALRVANPAFNGATTHESAINGQWTVDGTMGIVVEGVFLGLIGGPTYLLLRRFLGPTTLVRGVLAGVLLLIAFGSVILDGGYEYSRFVTPRISVPAFAVLFLLYGVVVASVADVIAAPIPMRHPRSRRIGAAALLALGAIGAWRLAQVLWFRYSF